MFDWQQKRAFKAVLTSPLLQAFLAVLIVLVGLSAWERYRMAQVMAERRAVAEAELANLEARQAVLEERVDYLSNERGLEAELRRQYDVAREGERVVVIVDPPAPEQTVEPLATTTTTTPRRWYQFWR
jgi:cell division protein FtsB